MDIAKLRIKALESIMNGATNREFADRFNLDPSHISQIRTGHRPMGDKAAKNFEAKIGLKPGTLLEPSWVVSDQDQSALQTAGKNNKLVPIKGFARMGQDGYYEEITEGSEGFVELPVSVPHSFALIARGDSMYPVIKDGQVIWCDASMPYHRQDNVAIYKENGAKMIKEFISSQNGVLEVKSVNGGEVLKIPLTEVRQIYAVRGVFSPSTIKYIE